MKILLKGVQEKLARNKGLIANFSYLTALQIFNMLVPIFTYPYLIRVLGKETYGLVIYAQVVVGYLLIIINFGFNSSAVKEISINRDFKTKLNEITSSIFILKSVLFLISVAILAIIINFLPVAREHKMLFILSMWTCLYEVIFPVWYFQGVEKMKYITYLSLISRSIFIILIFVFIKESGHYLRVPIIYGTGALISGILALIILYKKEKLVLVIPSVNTIYQHFRVSTDFFISEVFVKIFAGSNKLIIGTFLGLTELAYYDLADKIVNLFRGVPLGIVRSTIFPRVAKTRNLSIIRKTTQLMSLYGLLAVIVINIFAPKIVIIFGGKEMLQSVNILRLFSIIIFTTHLSNYYITIGLWSLGHERIFRNLMIYSSLVFFIIYLILLALNIVNVYTITVTPIVVDIYLLVHIYFIWKAIKQKPNVGKIQEVYQGE